MDFSVIDPCMYGFSYGMPLGANSFYDAYIPVYYLPLVDKNVVADKTETLSEIIIFRLFLL